MVTVFWFTLAVLFFLLWINKKSNKEEGPDSYRHGYWDGYRAFGDKVQEELDKDEIDRDQLRSLIASGYPDGQLPDAIEDVSPLQYDQIAPVAVSGPEPSIELTPEQHEAKTVRNLNTILYVASFLLVAAAAVFVAASMPASVRLLGVWAVVVLFYGAGLALHALVPRLRPAALAFLGTGLAILPFGGVALYLLGGIPGEAAWLFTSLIGLVAYFVAAITIKSQLVSYLTMAFVLSLGLSSVSVASAPIVWYFILLIGVSLLASTVGYLKPTWLPEVFRKPVETTGQIVTPVALLASVVVYDHMTLLTYELVFAVATAHYLVVWLQTRSNMYETVVRVVAHIMLLLIGLDVVDQRLDTFAAVWLIVAALQAGYSLMRLRPQQANSRLTESVWLGIMQGVILFGTVLWAAHQQAALGTLASFITIGVISVLMTLRLRRIFWASSALLVSLIAPFIVGRWLAEPMWEWWLIAWIFMIAAASVVCMHYLVRLRQSPHVKIFLQVAFWLYAAFAVLTSIGQLSSVVFGWVAMTSAFLAVVFSFISRQAAAEIVGGMLFVAAVASLLIDTAVNGVWYTTAAVLLSAVGLYASSILHHMKQQMERRDAMLLLAQVVLAGLVFNMGAPEAVAQTSLGILVAGAIISFGMRVFVHGAGLRRVLTLSYAVYPAAAWMLTFGLGQGWALLVYALAAVLFWAASHVERQQALVIGGNLALVAAVASMWGWLGLDVAWTAFGTAWIAAGLMYAMYLVLSPSQDAWRRQACLISVWVVLGMATLVQFEAFDLTQRLAAAGTLIVVAATISVEGYFRRNHSMIEAGVYMATFGAQRIVSLTSPEADYMVLYAHWWAIIIGLVAWWRQGDQHFTRRLMIAMAFLTAGVGIKALGEGGWYQTLFLIEHLGLLVIGALKQKRWALWWGVAATVAAVLYFLKDYPYMALAFLGLVLIAIVIWRLIRSNGKDEGSEL